MSDLIIALKQIIGDVADCGHPGKNSTCIYSYKESFDQLWELDKSAINTYTLNRIVIVDIGDFPMLEKGSIISYSRHLSVVDWAIAFLRKHIDNKNPPEIFVLCTQKPSNSDKHWWKKDKNWNYINSLSRLKICPIWDYSTTQNFIASINNSVLPANAIENEKQHLEILCAEWLRSITQGVQDHHSINNVIGPLLWATGLSQPCRESIAPQVKKGRAALLQKLLWSFSRNEDTNEPWFPLSATWQRIPSCNNKKLRVILVDDQVNDGWNYAIGAALGIDADHMSLDDEPSGGNNGSIGLCAYKSPDVIIAKLSSKINTASPYSPQMLRFELAFSGEPNDFSEILFLDLRLFSNLSGGTVGEELSFFKELLELYKNAGLEDRDEVSIGHSQSDFCALQAKIESWKENEADAQLWRKTRAYLEALCLLPKLLSYLDPSYPVIVFSSTGQRIVTEILRPCRNVMTELEKPRLDEYAVDHVPLAKVSLKRVMDKSLRILKTRELVRNLKTCDLKMSSKSGSAPVTVNEPVNYIEIFLDESGNDFISADEKKYRTKYVVGGLVVLYPDKDAAFRLHDKMGNKEVEVNGNKYRLVWTNSNQCIPKDLRKDTHAMKIVLGELKTVTDNESISIIPFAIAADGTEYAHARINLLDNEYLDNLNLTLIRSVLDVLIYDVIPFHIAPRTSADLKIWGAIRARNIYFKNLDIKNIQKQLKRDFGISDLKSTSKDCAYYHSLQHGSFMPLVYSVIAERKKTSSIKVIGARGVDLNTNYGRTDWPFRHIHFVADIVSNNAFKYFLLNESVMVISDNFTNYLFDVFGQDKSFNHAQAASHCLDEDDVAGALIQISKALETSAVTKRHDGNPKSMIPYIARKIGNAEISQDQFFEAVGKMPLIPFLNQK